MTARRPYASRGLGQRRAPRATGGGSARGIAALALLVVLVLGAGVWLRERLSPSDAAQASAVTAASEPSTFRLAPLSTPMVANPQDGAAAAAEQPPGEPAATGPTAQTAAAAETSGRARPTAIATLRHWDTSSSDVEVDPVLVGQLDHTLAGVEGTVSIAVKDLGSGRGAVLEGSREMQAASLFKLPVLYAIFEAGVPLSESLLITEEARSYDLGTMELPAGESLTVAEALERMVTISDTTSAIMLAGRVGSARITRDIAGAGMDTTHYSLERMTTSSVDMLSLLELIARGKAVSPTASAEMVHLLLRQKVNDRLPRLLDDDVRIAHKTGNLPGIVNDVGILYGPSSTVVVAALVSDTSNEAAAAAAEARVALIASNYFESQPGQRDRPTIPPQPARSVPPVWREPRPTAIPTTVPTPEPTAEEPSPTPPPVATATPAPAPAQQPTARPAAPATPTAVRSAPAAPATAPATAVPGRTAPPSSGSSATATPRPAR